MSLVSRGLTDPVIKHLFIKELLKLGSGKNDMLVRIGNYELKNVIDEIQVKL